MMIVGPRESTDAFPMLSTAIQSSLEAHLCAQSPRLAIGGDDALLRVLLLWDNAENVEALQLKAPRRLTFFDH